MPPAPVGCYTEDCVFRSFLIVTGDNDPGAGPLHKDDAFYTEYVKAQIQGRDFSWVRYGERNYNFGPGAPVRKLPSLDMFDIVFRCLLYSPYDK